MTSAVVLPTPTSAHSKDDFEESRPLLAITLVQYYSRGCAELKYSYSVKDVAQAPVHWAPTEVLIYSLRTHKVIRRLGAPQLDDPKFGLEASTVDDSEPAEDYCNVVKIVANPAVVAIVCVSDCWFT